MASNNTLFINFALFGTDKYDIDQQQQQQQQRQDIAVFTQNGIIQEVGPKHQVMKKITNLGLNAESNNDVTVVDGTKLVTESSSSSSKNPPLLPLLSPGFIDSHVHFLDGGGRLSYILDLSKVTSKKEFQQALLNHEKKLYGPNRDEELADHENTNNEWMFGSGWDEEYFEGKVLPTKHWIDEVIPNRPMLLYRSDLHSALVNQKALDICNITKDTPQPAGGVIVVDPEKGGDPTGLLRESAVKLARGYFPKTAHSRLEQALHSATDRFHRCGITCVHDMTTMDVHTNIEEFQFLRSQFREGKLKIRMRTAIRAHEFDDAVGAGLIRKVPDWKTVVPKQETDEDQQETDEQEQEQQEWPKPNSSHENQMLRLSFMKMFSDGSLGSRTAKMSQPYAPRCGELAESKIPGCNCGIFLRTFDDLQTGVANARQHGLLPCLHAIGDHAVQTSIDAFNYSKTPASQLEFSSFGGRIEHCQHILTKDLARLKEARLYASVQPLHMASDTVVAERVLGQWRRAGAFPFATLMRIHKVPIAFGSDWPVVDQHPGKAIFAAATRRAHWEEMPRMNVVPEEVPVGATAWDGASKPRECLSIRECLHNYTVSAAESCPGDGSFLGRICVGFAADFVILSPKVTELLLMTPEDVSAVSHTSTTEILHHDTAIYLKTFVNGEEVFSV